MVSGTVLMQLAIFSLSIGLLYALVGVGMAIIFGVMDVVNLVHGGIVILGAYMGLVFINTFEFNLLLFALPIALIAFVLGVILEIPIIERVVGKGHMVSMVTGWGLLTIAVESLRGIFSPNPQLIMFTISGNYGFELIPGVQLPASRAGVILISIPALLLLYYFLERTKLGLGIRAVSQRSSVSELMGVNPKRLRWIAYGVGTASAALGGVGISLMHSWVPFYAHYYTLIAFLVAVIGGMGSIPLSIGGALLLGTVYTTTAYFVDSTFAMVLFFLIFFVSVGIMGRRRGE